MNSQIDDVLQQMTDELRTVTSPAHRVFLQTYQRTTAAVGKAVRGGEFEDPGWVSAWDVVFAELYLSALRAYYQDQRAGVPRPWRLAFAAPPELPALRHVLLGINAHINYDLPQALLAVISDADFEDQELIQRRRRDHERIDAVLSQRVAAEDAVLSSTSARSLLDRALAPLNRLSSRRFLREARQKVWQNTETLHQARLESPQRYSERLAELEVLSAAKIADLLAPGQVLLRLSVAGFGVLIPAD
jgi:hypothetical protein